MSDPQPTLDARSLATHAGFVRSLARALLFEESDVDDVVQETWLVALEKRPHGIRSLRAWLGGVARKLALRLQRQ